MDVDFARAALPGNELHEYLHSLRARGPVVEVTFAKRPAWLILAYDELAAAFRDEEAFPAGEQYKRTIEPIQGRMFESMDGREHPSHRKSIPTVTGVFLERLPGLRLIDGESARPHGATVRGPRNMNVAFRCSTGARP